MDFSLRPLCLCVKLPFCSPFEPPSRNPFIFNPIHPTGLYPLSIDCYYKNNYLNRTLFVSSCLVKFATQPANSRSLHQSSPSSLSTFPVIFCLFTLLSNFLRQILSSHTLHFSTFSRSFLFKLLRTEGGEGVPHRALRANHSGSGNRYFLASFRRYFIFPRLACQTHLRFLNLPAAPISTP